MIYKIIVDKIPRRTIYTQDKVIYTPPSDDAKEYEVDIEELRVKGEIYDSLIIENGKAYVMRRLELTQYHVLKVLQNPIKQDLDDIYIELFEGKNYIYLLDKSGNKIYAEYILKNEFTDTFATTVELNTKIEQTSQTIMLAVNRKVGQDEFGTYIEMNWEAIKYAWNQISQYLQMEGIDGKATLNIYDGNNNMIMSLDQNGQHFFKSGSSSPFGEMGVKTLDNKSYISFSVPAEYNRSIQDGMAWGVTTESDGEFHPILFIKDFFMPPKNSGGATGELQLDGCNLVLGAENGHIISNGIAIIPEAIGGISFINEDNQDNYLSIIKGNGTSIFDSLHILDRISFTKNLSGTNTFEIGNGNSYCRLTDDGYVSATNSVYSHGDVTALGWVYGYAGIHSDGYVSGKAFIDNSREEIKTNIKKYDKKAIDIIKKTDIYEFNYKNKEKFNKKSLGFVIGDKYNYSKEITAVDNDGKEIGANLYSMVSVAYKAIQEQQEIIERQQKVIQELQNRIEKLEKEKS